MRRAIARKMTESKPGVPHIYVTSEIDMSEALKWRKQLNASGVAPVKISVNDMIVKAAAKALQQFPSINSSYAVGDDRQAGFVQHAQINVSVAIAIDEGLVAPSVTDADKKSLGTIAVEIRELATRAREGKIKPNELEGGTFTVSNLGMYDVVEFGMIITPPQTGAIAVGSVRQVPVVRDGEIVVGEVMHVSLSVDHRVADGATAAQYLQEFKRLMQSPMSMLV
jgi:pyruvate dehydrogenase E2 component (dihydrolipoamide acetyltransferase)